MTLATKSNPEPKAVKRPTDWLVVATNVHCEDRAGRELHERGFGVWWPRRVMEFRVGPKRHRACRLIRAFPGYLFVRPTCGATYHNVYGAEGVRALIAVDEAPLRVPDSEVLRLMRVFAVADFPAIDVSLRIGADVRIVGGPFDGFEAVVKRLAKGHAVVELDVMGRTTPMELDRRQLTPT